MPELNFYQYNKTKKYYFVFHYIFFILLLFFIILFLMQIITMIAAIGENNELGGKNDLLWNLPIDMQHFKNRTAGKTVIMGRRTFNSLGKPLPNRRNIVISKGFLGDEGIEVVHSIEEALHITNTDPEIMIMGGGEIYSLFLPLATHLSITRVHASFPEADTFFPVFSTNEFAIISEKKYVIDTNHAFAFDIQEWERTHNSEGKIALYEKGNKK